MEGKQMETYIISIRAENKPGVLARMTGIFGRRGVNIMSLTASPTLEKGVSSLTIVMKGSEKEVEMVKKLLNKLVEVIDVKLLHREDIIKELCLVKIEVEDSLKKSEVLQIASLFGAKISDMSPTVITFELGATPEQIDRFITNLKTFGIKEIFRTGLIATVRESAKAETMEEPKIWT